MNTDAQSRVKFLILASTEDDAKAFLDAAINRTTHAQVIVVTGDGDLNKIVGMGKTTPWYYLQGDTHNRLMRDAYYHIEQRLGPVWGGPAFVAALAEHVK